MILKFEQEIINLITIEQLFEKGIDGKGKKLKPEYTPFTVAVKNIKGQDTGHVTLFDTGALYKSFTTDYGNFVLEIFSTDKKVIGLETKYGDNIFSATVQHRKDINFKIIAPGLREFAKKIIR